MDGDTRRDAPEDDKRVSKAPADGQGTRREDEPGQDEGDDDKKQPPKKPMSRGKKVMLIVLGVIVLAALAMGGVLYWLHARQFENTDDAFIDGHIQQVSSQVSGRVETLLIRDNEVVAAGQELVRIDPRDYAVRLAQSRAKRANAAATARQAEAQVMLQQAMADQAAANVRVTEADLVQARQDAARYRAINPQAVSRQQVDQVLATEKSAVARLEANRQAVNAARAQVEAARAQAAAAEAQVASADTEIQNAELQLSYTHVIAPTAGRVTKRTVELGNVVQPGQALLSIVPDDVWVTANFKETQLAHMLIGQHVDIAVDALPDTTFAGHIDSFQAGSGSAFSSLPAENATGNYVKVVQRLPVKIVFDDPPHDPRLAPGLSVRPRVKVR